MHVRQPGGCAHSDPRMESSGVECAGRNGGHAHGHDLEADEVLAHSDSMLGVSYLSQSPCLDLRKR